MSVTKDESDEMKKKTTERAKMQKEKMNISNRMIWRKAKSGTATITNKLWPH